MEQNPPAGPGHRPPPRADHRRLHRPRHRDGLDQGQRSTVAASLIAAVFVLEPLAWWLYGLYIGGGAAYPVPGYPALWLSEIAIGIAGFVLLRRLASSRPSPCRRPGTSGYAPRHAHLQ